MSPHAWLRLRTPGAQGTCKRQPQPRAGKPGLLALSCAVRTLGVNVGVPCGGGPLVGGVSPVGEGVPPVGGCPICMWGVPCVCR